MLTISAPAKVNLSLEVLGKRPDGYHEIRSVLQAVSLCDTLSFETADGLSFECDNSSWQAEKSLVARAADILKREMQASAGALIRIAKRIPLSSGLGGDSSDAAAMLSGLNQLWHLGLPPVRRPKRDYLISSLAGPLANVVVVLACALLMQLTRHVYALGPQWVGPMAHAHQVLMYVALVNVVLGVLNLIPIPPLDGSKIWPCLIPGLKPGMKIKTTWVFIALLVVLMYTNALGPAINFVTDKVIGLLPMPDSRLRSVEARQGWKEIDANQFAEAEQSFTRALEIDPCSGDCYGGRAIARAALRRWQEALEDANRAIGLENGLTQMEYFEVRDRILDALGRPDDANADREQADLLRSIVRPPQAADTRPLPASAPSSSPEAE